MKKLSLLFMGSIILAVVTQAQVRITSTTPVISTTPAASSNVIIGNTAYLGTAGTGTDNTFIGNNVASSANTGGANTFVGQGVGVSNTSGLANTFIGAWAGTNNTIGGANTFIGQYCAYYNGTGSQNTFIGQNTGELNVAGNYNTFMGKNAGRKSLANTNTFIGHSAGVNTDIGQNNTFLGGGAGSVNINGSNNLALGRGADFTKSFFEYATAIGSGAVVDGSNAMVLGGTDLVTPRTNVNVGIGTTSPTANLHLEANTDNELVFVNTTKNDLITAFNMRAGIPAVVGNPNDLLITMNGPSASVPISGFGLYPNPLPIVGTVPVLPWNKLAMIATKQSPLYIGTYQTQTNNYAQNIHFVTGVDTSYPTLPKRLSPWECIRINGEDGFVGIHTRTAASSGTTTNPQALFHVNLTNPANARLNTRTQGIRFEGLPPAPYNDVIVVDAQGNLATRAYPTGAGGPIPCDSIIKCAWALQGNIVSATDFIGTLNNDDMRFRSNNDKRMRLLSQGSLSIEAPSGSNTADDIANILVGDGNSINTGSSNMVGGWSNRLNNTYASIVAGMENTAASSTGSAISKSAVLGWANTIQNHNEYVIGAANTAVEEYSGILGVGLTVKERGSWYLGGNSGTSLINNITNSLAIGWNDTHTGLFDVNGLTLGTATSNTTGTIDQATARIDVNAPAFNGFPSGVRFRDLPFGTGNALVVDRDGYVYQTNTILAKSAENDALATEIKDLKAQLAQLQQQVQNLLSSSTNTKINIPGNSSLSIAPTPFHDRATVTYAIDNFKSNAILRVTDSKGMLLKTIPLTQAKGQVEVNQLTTTGGMLVFSILVDGQIIVSKQSVTI